MEVLARLSREVGAHGIDTPLFKVSPPTQSLIFGKAVEFRRNYVEATPGSLHCPHMFCREPKTIEFIRPHNFGRNRERLLEWFVSVG